MQIIYNSHHRLHSPSGVLVEGCPYISEEVPERAEIILQALQEAGLGPVLEPQDAGLAPLEAVHDSAYLEYLRTAYEKNTVYWGHEEPVLPGSVAPRSMRRKPNTFIGLVGYYAYGMGSPILPHTWQAVYWSAQCALTAAALVRQQQGVQPAPAVYALCRPPGHHAAADLYGGFCYLNNAAIAARFLGGRGALLDIDFHHGNGTQEIFYQDPNVLFCSLHAHPDDDYPYYWGEASERGEGPGLGFNLNRPLPLGATDQDYLEALDEVLDAIRAYQPDWLVLSAGLDTAQGDTVGGFCITPAGFSEIGRRIRALGLPTVIVQEGGYLLETLGENALALLRPFADR